MNRISQKPRNTRNDGGAKLNITTAVTGDVALQDCLIQIWKDTLRRDSIDIDDDFFELGGHSLLAMRMAARVKLVLGTELPLKNLFEGPTIRQLVVHLSAESSASS
jgi:hypothetical protein